jgi:hypothetical protein
MTEEELLEKILLNCDLFLYGNKSRFADRVNKDEESHDLYMAGIYAGVTGAIETLQELNYIKN